MNIRKKINWMTYVILALSIELTACGTNGVQVIVSEISSEITETELFSESYETGSTMEESSIEKIRDNVTMYYDLDEIVLEGNKIPSSHEADYDLDNLMSVCSYEETGVKLYAYEDPSEEIIGYPFNKLKLLLEHDGEYQVFAQTEFVYFANMFGYCGEEYPYLKDFDEGYECDFDNDGRLELVKFIITDYGSEILETDIIVFDFNDETEEYEAYHTCADCFENLGNEALEAFFNEYYGAYTINERGLYDFGNGYQVSFFPNTDAHISEDGDIEMSVIVVSTHKEDSGTFWIGEMVFDVDYIGEGKFSVRVNRYVEWNNLMDPNLIEDYV